MNKRKHEAGKGDTRRSSDVSHEEYTYRYIMAFGSKKEKEEAKRLLDEYKKGSKS